MKRFLAPVLPLCLLAAAASAQTYSDPPVAVDINPDPNIVEINLTADVTTWEYIPGVQTTVYAYNGTVPGPTIEANVGNTLRVHFTNNLPEPTTIHWHGVETPADMDGSHIAQKWIQPGETFTYEYTVLNDKMAWYHPHVRVFDQLEKGLYGVLMFRNPAYDARLGINNIEEHIMVFDDVLLDANNQVVPAFSFTDPLQNAAYQLNGRVGNVLLINGKEASQAQLTIPNGQPQRWRVVNVANTTICRLDLRDPLDGTTADIWQIGTDGGYIDVPFKLLDVQTVGPNTGVDHPNQAQIGNMGEGILLFPAERMDVIFTPSGNDGDSFKVYQRDWFRGRHAPAYNSAGQITLPDDPMDGLYPKQQWLQVNLQGPNPGTEPFQLPPLLRWFPPLVQNGAAYANKLPMVFGHMPPDPQGNVTMFAQATFDANGNMTPLPTSAVHALQAHDVNVGETWLWEVTNLSHGDHTFHTHGWDFELVEYEYQDLDNPAYNVFFRPSQKRMYKDTIRIPARLGALGRSKSITRLKAVFRDKGREGRVEAGGEIPVLDANDEPVSSGGWLVHCHMLEHAARGMLSFFEVRDPSVTYHYLGSFYDWPGGPVHLSAAGSLTPGTPVTFHVQNAPPNTTVSLVVGNIAANRLFGANANLVPGVSFNGKTVVQNPRFLARYNLTSDANGHVDFPTTVWEQAAPGVTLYWQAGYKDPADGKWYLTNALSFTRP
ncbi:MAG TPA: multicopper oxidase family protein [Planctomycetes bacterium]|nr:multicopper oxidase family protein [Planctomycetota bacterium]